MRLPEPYATHHKILRRIAEYQRVTGRPMPRKAAQRDYGIDTLALLVHQEFLVWDFQPDTYSVRLGA